MGFEPRDLVDGAESLLRQNVTAVEETMRLETGEQ